MHCSAIRWLILLAIPCPFRFDFTSTTHFDHHAPLNNNVSFSDMSPDLSGSLSVPFPVTFLFFCFRVQFLDHSPEIRKKTTPILRHHKTHPSGFGPTESWLNSLGPPGQSKQRVVIARGSFSCRRTVSFSVLGNVFHGLGTSSEVMGSIYRIFHDILSRKSG